MIPHGQHISDYSGLVCLMKTSNMSRQQCTVDLNPVLLLEQINGHLERLWCLAERLAHQHRKSKTREASVTVYFDATRLGNVFGCSDVGGKVGGLSVVIPVPLA